MHEALKALIPTSWPWGTCSELAPRVLYDIGSSLFYSSLPIRLFSTFPYDGDYNHAVGPFSEHEMFIVPAATATAKSTTTYRASERTIDHPNIEYIPER